MKTSPTLCLIMITAVCSCTVQAQDINFSNRVETIRCLDGSGYTNVALVRGDLDGIIWREGTSGGRICYTNLSAEQLDSWGVPTNRISIAAKRAALKSTKIAKERVIGETRARSAQAEAERSRAEQSKLDAAQKISAQMALDSNRIKQIEQEIEAAKVKLRRAEAIARDYNHANARNGVPRLYIKDTERVKIKEAEAELSQMKREFIKRYGIGP